MATIFCTGPGVTAQASGGRRRQGLGACATGRQRKRGGDTKAVATSMSRKNGLRITMSQKFQSAMAALKFPIRPAAAEHELRGVGWSRLRGLIASGSLTKT